MRSIRVHSNMHLSSRGFMRVQNAQKSVFDRGSAPDPRAPDPAGGAHDAPPDPVVGSPFPSPSTPRRRDFGDCKALLVTSSRVSSAIASTRPLPFYLFFYSGCRR